MRQKFIAPEQNVRPGTEYARSIARYRPRRGRPAAIADYLSHPLAPAIALGAIALGVALLWPRRAHGSSRSNSDLRY